VTEGEAIHSDRAAESHQQTVEYSLKSGGRPERYPAQGNKGKGK